MASPAFIGFLAFCFVGMTLVNRILEGAFITASDVTIINTLTIVRSINLPGGLSIPVPNIDFILVGIPHLVKWDYSFFGGTAGILQYFMYSLTAAMTFALLMAIIGLLYNYFGRR